MKTNESFICNRRTTEAISHLDFIASIFSFLEHTSSGVQQLEKLPLFLLRRGAIRLHPGQDQAQDSRTWLATDLLISPNARRALASLNRRYSFGLAGKLAINYELDFFYGEVNKARWEKKKNIN